MTVFPVGGKFRTNCKRKPMDGCPVQIFRVSPLKKVETLHRNVFAHLYKIVSVQKAKPHPILTRFCSKP